MIFIVNRYCILCVVGIIHTQTQHILGQQDDSSINIQIVYTATTQTDIIITTKWFLAHFIKKNWTFF
jgi:hypothetical protein